MLYLALFIFIAALLLLWQLRKRQAAIGLPAGRIIYADTRGWGAVEQALYDAELGLVGRPDYLVEQDGQLIPVEVKSRRVSEAPFDAHIFQLAAYCLLVQRNYDKRPSHGILHYPNRTFAIDYTPALERALIDLLGEMHQSSRRKDVPRSHESAARCSACGFRSICDQRLL
jgi:CRISPR-associated exonuclease Cas4